MTAPQIQWREGLPGKLSYREAVSLAEELGIELYGLGRKTEPLVGLKILRAEGQAFSLLRLIREGGSDHPTAIEVATSPELFPAPDASTEGTRQSAKPSSTL